MTPFKDLHERTMATAVVVKGDRATFYTPDGLLYILFTAGGDINGERTQIRYLIVDINGGEGPNKVGRDVFYLTRVLEDGGGVQPYDYDVSNGKIEYDCNKATGLGWRCAEKIRRAGWKIGKDYPW